MEVRKLDQREYDRRLRAVIVGTEGLHAHVQDVGDQMATIGWGYTLNRSNNVEIWTRAGLELSPQQLAVLEQVDRAPRNEKTRIGLRFDKALTEAESDMLFRASLAEYEGPARRAGLPLSDERVAMVSVTYNRGVGALRAHPVVEALQDGDRAETWFQLRYNCWGSRPDMEGGLRKRRFAESEIFGLFDDPTKVSVEEASRVYATFRTHRAEIERVERSFGVTVEGIEARPNRIAQANRDYPDIIAEYGAVRTISESLAPARQVLLDHLRARYPQHLPEFSEDRFNAGDIDLDRFPARDRQQVREEPGALRSEGGDRFPDVTKKEQHMGEDAFHALFEAAARGDEASVRSATLALMQSPMGEAFLQQGDRLIAHQSAELHASLDQPAAQGASVADARG